MRDLAQPLGKKLRGLIGNGFSKDHSLQYLVNSVIDDTTDFEHIISFLEGAPSLHHRQFADAMKEAFEDVLRERLNRIRSESGSDVLNLYKVLIDMYSLDQCPEALQGIITTNYDEFLEDAVAAMTSSPVNFGVNIGPRCSRTARPLVLKLHGSFGWQDQWPISATGTDDATLWIPPGINKAKEAYPFNVLWGLARELLLCDVLRIVGCRLSPNDWDLISLLFTMRHVNYQLRPQIEVIDAPTHVEQLKKTIPYLEPLSILEVEPVGSQLIAEFTGWRPQEFRQLDEEQQRHVIQSAGASRNWFELWLRAKTESLSVELDTISTPTGLVETFLNA